MHFYLFNLKKSYNSCNKNTGKKNAGVTLVELMVVLSIITVMSGIIITNQGAFNNTLILSNTTYDVALAIRSAQTYGLSGRVFAGTKSVGYGLHFNQTTPKSFTLFADTNSPSNGGCHGLPSSGDVNSPEAIPGNCIYDAGESAIETYQLGNGMTISKLCAYSSSSTPLCGSGLSSLDIVFSRLSPEPKISTGTGGTTAVYLALNSSICLEIQSPDGSKKKYIVVTVSGQIQADAPISSCP